MDIDADRLLVLVEARPAIYNFNLKEHHNQDVINQLWNEIGQELNITGTLFTLLSGEGYERKNKECERKMTWWR